MLEGIIPGMLSILRPVFIFTFTLGIYDKLIIPPTLLLIGLGILSPILFYSFYCIYCVVKYYPGTININFLIITWSIYFL
jgi:hypothetical protein